MMQDVREVKWGRWAVIAGSTLVMYRAARRAATIAVNEVMYRTYNLVCWPTPVRAIVRSSRSSTPR
jgi:hypothetical protein